MLKVKRKAKPGEQIIITAPIVGDGQLKGRKFTISDEEGLSPGYVITEDHYIFTHKEYEVLLSDDQQKVEDLEAKIQDYREVLENIKELVGDNDQNFYTKQTRRDLFQMAHEALEEL